jgi:hypothetical protein
MRRLLLRLAGETSDKPVWYASPGFGDPGSFGTSVDIVGVDGSGVDLQRLACPFHVSVAIARRS